MRMSDYDRIFMNQEAALHEEPEPPKILFSLGTLVATPAALDALDEAGADGATYVERHQTGDCGAFNFRDYEYSVTNHMRVMSAYSLPFGVEIWIITEADRSATTILLPGDY